MVINRLALALLALVLLFSISADLSPNTGSVVVLTSLLRTSIRYHNRSTRRSISLRRNRSIARGSSIATSEAVSIKLSLNASILNINGKEFAGDSGGPQAAAVDAVSEVRVASLELEPVRPRCLLRE